MKDTVVAAGGIIVRRSPHTPKSNDTSYTSNLDSLTVCLVHRPKYDDWSWPKGKLDGNESIQQAAVREIQEETGLPVRLGAYLQSVEYSTADEGKRGKKRFDAKHPRKIVHYWIAQELTEEEAHIQEAILGPVQHGDDVDTVAWLTIAQARKRLTHITDIDVLNAFVDRVQQGALNAGVVILVRHGKAESRKTWRGSDPDRPLTPRGMAYSYAIARELACYGVSSIASSPWKRCADTMAPYAWQAKLAMASASAMTEDTFAEHPQQAWQYLLGELCKSLVHPAVRAIGMHRPVIGGMFEHLRKLCVSTQLSRTLPAKTPYMPTGHAVVLIVTNTQSAHRQTACIPLTKQAQPTDHTPLAIIDIQKVQPIVY